MNPTYAPGDRIRITGTGHAGNLATVLATPSNSTGVYDVLARPDGKDYDVWFYFREVEPAPLPSADTQALRERLIALAIQSGPDTNGDSVVTVAAAFEAYITGATK